MKKNLAKIIQAHSVLLLLLTLSGCQIEKNPKSIVNFDATSALKKQTDEMDQKASKTKCKTSKGVSLTGCDLNLNLACTSNASGEFCSQMIGSSEARVWGPY